MYQPDPLSLASVHMSISYFGQGLGTASGFVIGLSSGPFLVTAKHNLTAREIDGRPKHPTAALPNIITLRNFFGSLAVDLPLYEEGNEPAENLHRYLMHRDSNVDLALLPLPRNVADHQVNLLSRDLWYPTSFQTGIPFLRPADLCHVIGYPEGLTNELGDRRVLPIWKTGHLANDSQFKFNEEDVCLIDATTRPGMSGSPVFVVDRAWNGAAASTRLVGVYAGRTSETSDLGRVWQPKALHEILDQSGIKWR